MEVRTQMFSTHQFPAMIGKTVTHRLLLILRSIETTGCPKSLFTILNHHISHMDYRRKNLNTYLKRGNVYNYFDTKRD